MIPPDRQHIVVNGVTRPKHANREEVQVRIKRLIELLSTESYVVALRTFCREFGLSWWSAQNVYAPKARKIIRQRLERDRNTLIDETLRELQQIIDLGGRDRTKAIAIKMRLLGLSAPLKVEIDNSRSDSTPDEQIDVDPSLVQILLDREDGLAKS